MPEVVLVMGCNGAGKTTFTKENFPNHFRINRDDLGGKLDTLDLHLEKAIIEGKENIVLDNTYKTVKSRQTAIEMAKKHDAVVRCFWMTTTTDQAMINVCMRMMAGYGKILGPDEIKQASKTDPGIFPVAAIFGYHSQKDGNKAEDPKKDEGIDDIIKVDFHRKWPTDWTNKGVILDYDDTLRYILPDAGCTTKYPTKPEHVGLLPRRQEILQWWQHKDYTLYGASNQSGIAKGVLTDTDAQSCFTKTNDLLGFHIPVNYCPHIAGAAICYCRKPAPGLLIQHMWQHKLDPKETIFVGDQTTDKTCANRLGIKYFHESEFFKE